MVESLSAVGRSPLANAAVLRWRCRPERRPLWHTTMTPTPDCEPEPRPSSAGKVHEGVAAALVGRQSKLRSHLESVWCRGENLLGGQVVPWTTDGLGSPDDNAARGPVSKIVDSCQHLVTTADQDRGRLLTLKVQALSRQQPQVLASPLLVPRGMRLCGRRR